MTTPRKLVWISGATSGIGRALAATAPDGDARVISLSRRLHPERETVHLELTDRESWYRVGEHFREVLGAFRGESALFIHNAYVPDPHRFAGEGDLDGKEAAALGNGVGAIVLGELFLEAAGPAVEAGVDVGLVMMSSASARIPYEGLAVYCAAKASMEQWVRAVRLERARRGCGPWVIAVRPGFVDTPGARRSGFDSEQDHPNAPFVAAAIERGDALDEETAARNIWGALPPSPDEWLLMFGEAVTPDA
jgi:NAD(P)-dependent dehydrogenase (short-subunit alcohol dehydrogenase family)